MDTSRESPDTVEHCEDETAVGRADSAADLEAGCWGAQEQDIVQFSDAIYYALEGEDVEIAIDIIRLGGHTSTSSVSYHTEDASAEAGAKYIAMQGIVEFAPGESVKTVCIPIINDELWGTDVEFKVRLENPQECELGRYLHTCRVKIIDDDYFPTNRYKTELEERRIHEIFGPALLLEYIKRNLMVPGIGWRTAATLLIDQFHNLYFVIKIYLNIYMVDVVFDRGATEGHAERKLSEERGAEEEHALLGERLLVPGSRHLTLVCLAALYVLPFLFLHIVDLLKVKLSVAGISQQFLQQNLYKKYLNYNEKEREKVVPSALALCIIKETVEVAEFGFVKCLAMARILGKLAVTAFFVYREHPEALLAIIIFPCCMVCWIALRMRKFIRLGEDKVRREMALAHDVQETHKCYRLVADYHQRPLMIDRFTAKVLDLRKAVLPLKLEMLNSSYCSPWVSTLLTAGYLAFFSGEVLSGRLSLGMFLAMLKIFSELGTEFQEAFKEGLELAAAIGPLEKVTAYMNGETDLHQKRKLSLARREEMRTRRKCAMSARQALAESLRPRVSVLPLTTDIGAPAGKPDQLMEVVDSMPLCVEGVRFRYSTVRAQAEDDMPSTCNTASDWLIEAENLEAPQGSMVAVIGPHRAGKSTFMRILAGLVEPQEGQVFIPTHLRVLHVTQLPIILEASLWENLTFGHPSEDPARVERIANRLCRLGQAGHEPSKWWQLSKPSQDGHEHGKWWQQMSATDWARVNLARALVVNPEVLVINRPAYHFAEEEADHVLEILAEHVKMRGIELDEPPSKRRPRTCFYTSDAPVEEAKKNSRDTLIWEVRDNQVKVVERSHGRRADAHAMKEFVQNVRDRVSTGSKL